MAKCYMLKIEKIATHSSNVCLLLCTQIMLCSTDHFMMDIYSYHNILVFTSELFVLIC